MQIGRAISCRECRHICAGRRGPSPERRCEQASGSRAGGSGAPRTGIAVRRSLRGPRGGRVDRAQRSGASLNTATRGKPLRRGAENLRGPAGDRRPSAAAPFAGTPQGRASQALATAAVRTGVQRPDPDAQRSGARGRVGTGNGCGNGIGNGCDLAHIYTYIPLPTQHERPSGLLPPDSVRGRRPGGASVCGRAGARMMANSGAYCKCKTVKLFTE